MTGTYIRTAEHRANISKAKKGKSNGGLGRKHSEETKNILGNKNIGKKLSNETKKKISETMKRLKLTPPSSLGIKRSQEYKDRLSKALKGKPRYATRGENNANWKGGKSSENNKVRHSLEIKLWRDAVFARDGYTCQKTGQIGGKLRCHHILNFAQYPELRFAIDNGITLSNESHKEFHRIYGIKNNTKEQIEEYLKK